jgi:nitrite reductase/ring-hydroxylating ferredoxin subunit
MAASSHDFWLAQWSAPVWKRLHLGVYGAYWLVVLHVALGPLQDDARPGAWAVLLAPAAALAGLQLTAAWRERSKDREPPAPAAGWLPIGDPASIPDGRARLVVAGGERVAVFRDGQRLFALSGVCQHQNGPLGEGRVRAGCAVCPWHGYEYRLESGRSPEPFQEAVPQFRLRIVAGQLELDPRPLPPGSSLPPLEVQAASEAPPEPFFVGYAAESDPALRAAWRRRALLLAGPLLLLSALTGALQPPFARSAFEFGRPRELSGWIGLTPAPHLAVPRPGSEGFSRYLLVAQGKHGAAELAAPFDGRFVSLSASLAHRDGATLLELVPDSIQPAAPPALQPEAAGPRELGPQRLRGEIVDSKCFLGVMKPGELKSHRACASLCIRGGIPPVLCVRRDDGSALYWLLVDAAGGAINQAVLPYVAEPVEIEGQGQVFGDLRVLRVDPADIRRL